MVRSPEPIEQIRSAPVRVLRAVFSGVGQLLMAADRLREEDAEQARESGEESHDPLASWDGRLSSSVRLIPPTGSSDEDPPASAKPAAASATAAPASVKPTPARKAKRAQPSQATRTDTSSRTGKNAKTSRSTTSASQPKKAASAARKSPSDVKGTTTVKGTKTTNAEASRKSGRSKAAGPEPSRFRSLDLTGNVRMLSNADIADMTADEFERSADAQPNPAATQATATGPAGGVSPETARPPWSQAAPAWSQAAPAWSSWSTNADAPPRQDPAPAAADQPRAVADPPPALTDPPTLADPPPAAAVLPIASYDDLSLPSLRARLRNLDSGDLAVLLAHERSHANREDIVTMFERRIVRLIEADAGTEAAAATEPDQNQPAAQD